MKKPFHLLLISAIFLTGCFTFEITSFTPTDPALTKPFTPKSFNRPELKPYIIDGVIISPYFKPQYSYDDFMLLINVLTVEKGKSITIEQVSIDNDWHLSQPNKTIATTRYTREQMLYRNHQIIVEHLPTASLAAIIEHKKTLKVSITVKSGNQTAVLNYSFNLLKKNGAAPLH